VSQSAVLAGARLVYRGNNSDPLTPYEAIMPGQPAGNIGYFSCDWRTEYIHKVIVGACRTNADDTFPSFNVSVGNGLIQSLGFQVNDLVIGDLAQYWGHPEIGAYSVRWYRRGYVITVLLSGRFSYWSPVQFMYVEAANEAGSS
jgi:hypothetical protein